MEDRGNFSATLRSPPSTLHSQPSSLDPRSSIFHFLLPGWAVFLAASWTWCIGMFLPVLMVRDYGIGGFLVFVIPNMIGAAAMGTVLATSQASRRIVAAHGGACAAFSTVTILFHAFFVAWVVRGLIGAPAIWITAALTLIMLAPAGPDRSARALAACVFGISLVAFATAFSLHGVGPVLPFANRKPAMDLLGLAGACTFGFAFCPYLDLTFHRAREKAAPREGAAAFALGFLGLFPLMILFTLWYAPRMAPGRWSSLSGAMAWIIAAHLMLQTALTVSFHVRALTADRRTTGAPAGSAIGFIAASLLVGGAAALGVLSRAASPGEMIYRLFMAFYALPFPAYVWICMCPLRGQAAAPSARRLTIFAITLLAAGPLFWLAFFQGHMLLLIPAVAVILLAGFIARKVVRDQNI